MKDTTADRLLKAERAIQSAKNLLHDGDLDFAVSRAYYAMFYVAEALLDEKGLQFRKHGGVHGGFSKYFVKTGDFDAKYGRWLVSAFNQRTLGDYGVSSDFDVEDVEEIIGQAQEFLEVAKKYLGGR